MDDSVCGEKVRARRTGLVGAVGLEPGDDDIVSVATDMSCSENTRMVHRSEYVVFAGHVEPPFLTKNVDKRKQKQNIKETYRIG